MTTSYYGCTAKHNEFTCLSQYYQTTGIRRFHYNRWCETCKKKYRNPATGHVVPKETP